MEWLKSILGQSGDRPFTYSMPSPGLSVDARRQSYADALLKSAKMFYDVSQFEDQKWGVVRLYTMLRKPGGVVELMDGWVRVEDPPILPDLGLDPSLLMNAAKRDFYLSVPSVRYVVEIDVGGGIACALCFGVLTGRDAEGDRNEQIVTMIIAPVNGNQWRNHDYDIRVYRHLHMVPLSCTEFVCYAVTELSGGEMRDLMKISALMNYFTVMLGGTRTHYVFVTGAGVRMRVEIGYVAENVVITYGHPLVEAELGSQRVVCSPRQVMDWAETLK